MIQDFPKGGGGGGGLMVMHGCMAMARGSFCHVCLTFVAKLYDFCGILHLFIAARFLLACVFGELVRLSHLDAL